MYKLCEDTHESELIKGIRNQIVQNLKSKFILKKYHVAELNNNKISVYNYRTNINIVPKNLRKIGHPKLPLYDLWVKYFFTSAFKPDSNKKQFRSISPRPNSQIKYRQNNAENSRCNMKTSFKTSSKASKTQVKTSGWEEQDEAELLNRLYNSK